MKKRIVYFIIVLTMILSMMPFNVYATAAKMKFQASSWAVEELEKADKEGLIPETLKEADLTGTISREEFAVLAVRLYEKATGTEAATSPNPFTDTDNLEILKAYKLGITLGTSSTTFSPKTLINREQCASMLYRTLKTISPDGDYITAGVRDFTDQEQISDWALEGTKYMSKLGIIKNDNNGNFMPKAITAEQEAAGYGMASREAAILMSVRSLEQIKSGALGTATDSGTAPVPEELEDTDSTIVGTWILGTLSGGSYNSITGKYEGGATGLGQEYIFKSDGSYSALVIWSNTIFLSGNYSVKDGVITLTDRSAEESNDGGSTWGEKEILPDAWAHFIAGTDEEGEYLLIGEEGVEPPLIDKTNARKYRAKQ